MWNVDGSRGFEVVDDGFGGGVGVACVVLVAELKVCCMRQTEDSQCVGGVPVISMRENNLGYSIRN